MKKKSAENLSIFDDFSVIIMGHPLHMDMIIISDERMLSSVCP